MAKELIDLGTPGQPTTGDNLPVGGEKLIILSMMYMIHLGV